MPKRRNRTNLLILLAAIIVALVAAYYLPDLRAPARPDATPRTPTPAAPSPVPPRSSAVDVKVPRSD